MLRIRRYLCSCFGLIAAIYLFATFFTISRMFSPHSASHPFPLLHAAPLHFQLLSTVLLALSELVRAMPLLLGALYAMAWWTVKQGKASGRSWAIAASVTMILQTVPFFLVPILFWTRYHQSGINGFIILGLSMLALGLAGVAAFWRRDAMARPVYPAKPLRIAGDGTSRLLDGMVWLLAIAGYIACEYEWMRWGHAQHLPVLRGPLFWLVFAAAILVETTAHELGHTVTGLALGMKLRAFIVGPLQWRIRDGQWKFQFLLAKMLSAGGATALVPTSPRQSRRSEIYMIAAGPLASLLSALIAAYAALKVKGTPYEPSWQLFALISTFGVIAFAVNLVPGLPGALYTDGAQIYQLLRGGPWADLHDATTVAASTLVTPLRPRDYDIEAIQRAKQSFTQGRQAFVLRLLASSYFLDRGLIPEASHETAEAERICHESALDISAELCMALVFRTAFLRRDVAGTRQWWERMEAGKPAHFGVDYWLAKSALCWIENRGQEAREAWDKGNTLAQKLPAAGDYEFDRFRCALLRRELDAMSSTGKSKGA